MSPLEIASDVDLTDKNTFSLTSSAKYFASCTNVDQLKYLLEWARTNACAACVFSGGSNILLDKYIDALVIRMDVQGKTITNTNSTYADLCIGAGENWHALVEWTLAKKFYGLENLSLIPGSVGAAPVQNIGAYGVEVGDLIHKVTALDITTGQLVDFSASDCAFEYRDSLFKRDIGNRYIICEVNFRLATSAVPKVHYPALREYLLKQNIDLDAVTPEQVSDAVVAIRSSKLPDPAELPNVGSFFKNPIIANGEFLKLKKKYADLPAFNVDDEQKKIPAAWLIDKLGWKGRSLNGVGVHKNHALVLINPNKKSLDSVMALAERIQKDVATHFSIALEIEPQPLCPRLQGR